MHKLIAVVDDEPDIVELVTHRLEKEGFRVKAFHDGKSLLDYIRATLPDLIILDLMLPEVDGLDVCRVLKKDERTSSVPIIMLTAKGTETDRVVGLELGADDYMVKPFSPRELLARVKAVLRRVEAKAEKGKLIKIDDLLIYPGKFEVTVRGKKIDLTTTEFKILSILAQKPGWVFTRDQLLDRLWGEDKIVIGRTIDVHITRLRKKLGGLGKSIRAIKGVGYKFER